MKNKKLFGIFNLLDIIIILVVIAAIVFAAIKVKSNRETVNTGETLKATYIEFYDDDVNDFIKGHIEVGSLVKDATQSIDLGTVMEVNYVEPEDFNADMNGKVITGRKEGYTGVKIKVRTNGKLTENGMQISSYTYYVNKSMEIRAGQVALYPRVSDMGIIEE